MGQEGQRPYRRRHWLVDRSLQFRFIRVLLLLLLVISVGALVSVYVALRSTLKTFELATDPLAVALFTTVWLHVALQILIIAPFVVLAGIVMTHKIAGPLVRIKAALEQMARGDFNVHLTLRRGDALHDLAALINQLAGSLRNRSA